MSAKRRWRGSAWWCRIPLASDARPAVGQTCPATNLQRHLPSAARFAHEEMLGFTLVRISVLGNIFSARDLHSSLFSFRVPHCASYAMSLAYRRSRINCQRYPAPPRAATLERSGALTQTSRLLLWNRPVRFFFSVCAVTNFAPISSPLTQASSQRRYVRPVDDNRGKLFELQALDRVADA